MSRRPQPQNLDITGANTAPPRGGTGRLTPGGRPNFYMDLPSPRVGEVPPALSPLDAFALHSRVLARKLEESTKAGRRLSRLPHHEIQTELAKRPGYFRSMSSESENFSGSADELDEDDEDEDDGDEELGGNRAGHHQPKDFRPVSQYPFLGNVEHDDNDEVGSMTHPESPAPPMPQPQSRGHDGHGYFGIQVPRSSSPEPFDSQVSKADAVSPTLPSLTSSIDSIQSSQPRTLTNESSSSKAYQAGLAPPRSPFNPKSARSIASIRSVIDSAEEDNGGVTGFERVKKSTRTSPMSKPHSPMTPDFHPISRSPSAMSEMSVNDPLPRPSFNFSRPRSSSALKLAFDRRPSAESRQVTRKPSNPSSLRDAVSANQADGDTFSNTESLSVRAPSRQNSGNSLHQNAEDGIRLGRVVSRKSSANSVRGPGRNISRQNSGNSVLAPGPGISRQNTGNSIFAQGPTISRQNSANSIPALAPSISRQNSGNSLPLAGPAISRQNSENSILATAPSISRQNSSHDTEMASPFPDVEVFSGDEAHYGDGRDAGAQSYIYSKYSLPRGRTIERTSAEARKSWVHHQLKWEEANPPPSRPVTQPVQESLLGPRPAGPLPSQPVTPTRDSFGASANRSRSAEPPGNGPSRAQHKSVPSSPSITSTSTDRTIRGRAHVRNSPSQDIVGLSPEEHLEKGIEFHNSGSLSKSTYHLRLAARANLPTAMLLYALACRHGWGMRPNQAEGVAWLKRAVDSSSLEFMADNDPLSTTAPGDKQAPLTAEQKTRKAQFALAIYELGMSYMNGWGIPRDRSLALRCFEIAGSWGDNDALAEAGFCYAQGVGCRKDLKKAAGFYRRAADGGMSMAGQSWIYKPKYMEDPPPKVPSSANAPHTRARGKSFWRKKAPAVS